MGGEKSVPVSHHIRLNASIVRRPRTAEIGDQHLAWKGVSAHNALHRSHDEIVLGHALLFEGIEASQRISAIRRMERGRGSDGGGATQSPVGDRRIWRG